MKSKRILVTGSNGQLGRELKDQMNKRGYEYIGYDIPDIDITDQEQVKEIVAREMPDMIINSAALTNVDGCEEQQELADQVNGYGAGYLAQEAANLNIPIVQVSTDYVFDGNGIEEDGILRPYVESDSVDPQSAYGSSKLLGEQLVQKNNPKHFIVRTAWLYGDGNNFVRTMLKLAEKYDEITVVNDQKGSPTSTEDLASAILDLVETEAYGIYHATAEGECVWSDFSAEIFKQAGKNTKVIPVTSEEYAAKAGKTVAKRPAYSVLENKGLKTLGIGTFRPWQEELQSYLIKEKIINE